MANFTTTGSDTYPTGHILEHQVTSFPSDQFVSATTDVTHRSSDVITISNVPAGCKLVAMFMGGYFEPTPGYGNTLGFQINGVDYANLSQGGYLVNNSSTYRTTTPCCKTVTFAGSTDSVVVKMVITRNGGTYMEWRIGGAAPAEMNVFVIKG